ncbi:gamma-glutamyl-gamma-aminobutyrate hydrolase family protein [Streptomyces diacarni]|uniref:gamma-glutamyl-gamma-aminobutyrate hydrolase family protein n=1 Tax=Streptomyces diacarni TaxID=2800381 RepID=UPI0015F06D37|nr:gamma-glutamyl-gamma-aminobutyrate hydrolase family protein [Streptomyces diacarni]
MTLIGITQRVQPANEFGERRDALDIRWPDFFAACGIAPVPLPNRPDLVLTVARESGVRGLVLSGGDDLAVYGGPSPHRDETENRLLAWAVEHDIPVLGVCRGMQIILRAYGTELTEVSDHVATRHTITQGREVNSYHRMAARAVLPPLRALAYSGDVVEAVEHDHARVQGIMWHPERERPFDPRDVHSVRAFFSTSSTSPPSGTTSATGGPLPTGGGRP